MDEQVCVLGLGYVGLPTAALLADSGLRVAGVDVSEARLAQLGRGEIPTDEADVAVLVRRVLKNGSLTLSPAPRAADLFIIAVPTPVTVDHRADLTMVVNATKSIADVIQPGSLVILESTVPPGTTDGVVRETLKRCGVAVDTLDFAHCPERVLPGDTIRELRTNSRIIGASSERARERTVNVYRRFVTGDVHTCSVATAEFTKLAENTFRDVNIALANELAMLAQHAGLDYWKVRSLANRHPRVSLHSPGPGVGGHCIPVDPWFLAELATDRTQLIQQARAVNDHMPEVTAAMVAEMLGGAGIVAQLGLSYKADVADTRESPAWDVLRLLKGRGIDVRVVDPVVAARSVDVRREIRLWSIDDAVHQADLVLLVADHAVFRTLDPVTIAPAMRTRKAVDTRGVWPSERWIGAGFALRTLGVG